MSTIRVVNIQHSDATEPNIVLNADGTATFVSGITISGGTKLTVSGTAEFASGTVSAPGITFIDDNNTGIYSPGADQLAISTNGTQALYIDSDGDILVADGNRMEIDEVRARDGDGLKLFDDAGAGIFVQDGGNVGIGTSSPQQTLHVVTTSAESVVFQRAGAGGGVKLDLTNGDGNTWDIYNDGAELLNFRYNDSPKVVVNSAGNVGIGTTSPSEKLEINSGTGNTPLKLVSSDANVFIHLEDDATTLPNRIGATGNNIVLYTENTERLRLDSSGRLLVGTSSARSNYYYSTVARTPGVQYEDSGSDTSLSVYRSDGLGALYLANGSGSITNGTGIGGINFVGNDGTNLRSFAKIEAECDGTIGTADVPGRLVFSVTADGSDSPSEAMRINKAGELLVGYTSDNGAYKLQVNSQIFATSATIATSDGRYKENVAALDGCVDLVKALRPVSFDWKAQEPVTRVDEDGETVVVREAHNFPDGKQVGFIAQEVEEVLADKPWLGSVIKQNVRPSVTDADGNELAPEEKFLGIAEGNLVAVLTSALKDAIGRIETLEANNADLLARVSALEAS